MTAVKEGLTREAKVSFSCFILARNRLKYDKGNCQDFAYNFNKKIILERKVMSLGDRIRSYRTQRDLSQEQLGKLIGVEPGVISNYENNKYKPSAETIVQLAKAFYTSTDNLLLDKQNNQLKEVIPNQELLDLFVDIMSFPKEEQDAVKTIIKSLSVKNKQLNENSFAH